MAKHAHKLQPEEQCIVEGCEDPKYCLDMCRNCYQSEVRWAKRKPKDRHKYLKALKKRQARMERLIGPPKMHVIRGGRG